jgi:hypothetical protein
MELAGLEPGDLLGAIQKRGVVNPLQKRVSG